MKINKILSQKDEEVSEKRHFDKKALIYDKQYGYDNLFTKYKIGKKSRDLQYFANSIFTDHKIKLLEIGCGTGEYTKVISKLFPNVKIMATDISPKSIEVAKKKCLTCKNVNFSVRSAYDTKYKNESFDLVYGFYVLHHLNVKKVAKEVYRILKKGGGAYFYEPNLLNPYVYLVKSNQYFKNKVGDSPDEWAINPLRIRNDFKDFNIDYKLTEFVLPISQLPLNYLKFTDNLSTVLSYVPLLKYLGGSVQLRLRK